MVKDTSVPLPSGVSSLLQLFDGPLSEVRFPDVDGAALAALAEEAGVAVGVLAVARTAVAAARATLSAAESSVTSAESLVISTEAALMVKAQRALAYARVFAEGDAALKNALDAIALPATSQYLGGAKFSGAPAVKPALTPRGRPRSGSKAPIMAIKAAPQETTPPAPTPADEVKASPSLFVVPAHDELVASGM